MKLVIAVALAFVAVAVAAPVEEPEKILRDEFNQYPDGSYDFIFETEKGIVRQEKGMLKQVVDEENKPQTVVAVEGSYSYPSENGIQEIIKYFSDETGYHADGPSVPKVLEARR